ncbi:MAG: hypothetical protein ACREXM_19175 [Gammaproteobacteria bacterium]
MKYLCLICAETETFAAIDAVEHDMGPLACPTFADLTAHFGRGRRLFEHRRRHRRVRSSCHAGSHR